jgi:hypothetical protein
LAEAYALRRTRSDDFPWLDLDNDRIILPATFAKSDEDQWLPLHPLAREALLAMPDDATDRLFPFRSRKGGGPYRRPG